MAWQKQLRDRYASETMPPVPHLDIKRAEVRPVSYQLAKHIILKYEWLGAMATTSHHFGIFFGDYCAGVCCVCVGGGGANLNAHKLFGVPAGSFAYLARGANVHWSPKGANSKLVSWTCRLLARDTQTKIIIAYSDTDAGEIGTIYQACNWAYIGQGASTRQWIAPNGRIFDQKYPYDKARRFGGTRADWVRRLRDAGWTEQASNPKHRYVCVLDTTDSALVARVEAMRQSYPKRARAVSIEADVPGVQPGEGGAVPTAALQLSEAI